MTPEQLRSAMRAFGKVSESNIERAISALVDGGAAQVITEPRPIKTKSYLGFADATGVRVAWLHVGHIDILASYAPAGSFQPDAYPHVRRVAFPGYTESRSPTHSKQQPAPCQQCFNAIEYCDCET